MKTKLAKFIQFSVAVVLSTALSACVVAPVQPVGYRVTSTTIPTYYESSTTVVQTTTPVYSNYYPAYPYYNRPVYVDPWYGVGVGVGIGIGVNYSRGGCCWRGGYRSGYRGGWRRR
jgi:hypothetical protein